MRTRWSDPSAAETPYRTVNSPCIVVRTCGVRPRSAMRPGAKDLVALSRLDSYDFLTVWAASVAGAAPTSQRSSSHWRST